MKRFLIVFIIMVLFLTFLLTRDKKIDEANIITESDIADYKQSIIDISNKNGWKLTEEKLNEMVSGHINIEISNAKSKAEGMELGKALKVSITISALLCLAFFIITIFTSAHYGEINHHTELHNLDTTGPWSYSRRKAKSISEFFDNFWSSK